MLGDHGTPTLGPMSDTSAAWRIPGWFRRLGIASWLFVGVIVAASLIVAVLGATSDIVAPVTLAVMLAVVFQPIVDALEERRVPRPAAALAVLAGLVLIAAGTIWMVVWTLIDQADELGDTIDDAVADIRGWLDDTSLDAAIADRVRDAASDSSGALLGGASRTVVSVFDTAFGFITGSILGAIVLYYLLKDLPRIASSIAGREEERSERRALLLQIGSTSAVNVRRYYRGRTALAFVNGAAIAVAAVALDVPAVAAIAVVNFIGSYIPYLGGFVGGAFAVLLALGDEGVTAALIMLAVTLLVNLLLENLLEPALIGDALQLHPLLVLLATTLGGITIGMLGLVLAAPLTAIALDVQRQLRAAGFFDQ